jgi:hypothetical protein
MKTKTAIINACSVAAIFSLLLGLGAGILAFLGLIDLAGFQFWFNVCTVIWFISSPFWFAPSLFGPDFARAGDEAWLRPKKP